MRKIVEILEDIWYRLKWAGKFIIGGLIMGYSDFKESFERRKRKGV